MSNILENTVAINLFSDFFILTFKFCFFLKEYWNLRSGKFNWNIFHWPFKFEPDELITTLTVVYFKKMRKYHQFIGYLKNTSENSIFLDQRLWYLRWNPQFWWNLRRNRRKHIRLKEKLRLNRYTYADICWVWESDLW